MAEGQGVVRGLVDRALRAVARAALWLFFRDVEVVDDGGDLDGRPVLVVANHFYGFIDPILLVRVLGRLPRFLAKSTLWRNPLLRPLLSLANALPVRRPEDGSDAAGNAGMFDACDRALARGEWVGIFPEGTTHDHASLKELRTGAARIALGAYAAGVRNLAVVPVGLLFDDKLALRGRVLARVGRPLSMDDVAAALVADGMQPSDGDRDAVREVTAAMTRLLGEVAPRFRDEHQAKVLRRAGEVALRAGGDALAKSMEAQDEVARAITAAGDEHVAAVTAALGAYHLDLDMIGIGDLNAEARADGADLLRRTVWATVRLVVTAPFAALGLAWNVLPFLLVQLVGRAIVKPIRKGSMRMGAALLLFPAMWTFVALTDPLGGWGWGVAVFLAAPVLGLIAVRWLEAVIGGYRDWRAWIVLTDRRAVLGEVEASRAAVVAAVDGAVVAGNFDA